MSFPFNWPTHINFILSLLFHFHFINKSFLLVKLDCAKRARTTNNDKQKHLYKKRSNCPFGKQKPIFQLFFSFLFKNFFPFSHFLFSSSLSLPHYYEKGNVHWVSCSEVYRWEKRRKGKHENNCVLFHCLPLKWLNSFNFMILWIWWPEALFYKYPLNGKLASNWNHHECKLAFLINLLFTLFNLNSFGNWIERKAKKFLIWLKSKWTLRLKTWIFKENFLIKIFIPKFSNFLIKIEILNVIDIQNSMNFFLFCHSTYNLQH